MLSVPEVSSLVAYWKITSCELAVDSAVSPMVIHRWRSSLERPFGLSSATESGHHNNGYCVPS